MFYRDRVAGGYKVCAAEGCDNLVLPPKRKCFACKKLKAKATDTLRPTTRGKNKRGVCLHKAEKSRVKRAKRQNASAQMNVSPKLKKTKWEEFK